jgi:hypothetical protein
VTSLSQSPAPTIARERRIGMVIVSRYGGCSGSSTTSSRMILWKATRACPVWGIG